MKDRKDKKNKIIDFFGLQIDKTGISQMTKNEKKDLLHNLFSTTRRQLAAN